MLTLGCEDRHRLGIVPKISLGPDEEKGDTLAEVG